MGRLLKEWLLAALAAVAATGATVLVLLPLQLLIEPLPAPPFLLTVMIVAWLGGFRAASITTILSALAVDYWFIPPIGAITSTWQEIASTIAFAVVGIAVAWLTATRRHVEDERKALLARERASRAAAEAANRAKDEFVAVLGHECRNPLSAIVNAVQLLGRVETTASPAHDAREVIERQAKAIGRMVEDLLEVNRIATGKIRLDRQPTDLSAAIRRALATLASRTQAHRVTIEATPVWVDADPVRLEQILVNLFDNALKYTPVGGAIDIRLEREGRHAVCRVRDSGVGIDADVLPRIFELFVQGDAASRHGRRGLGIGLAVVRRLVELHGGTINAASDGPGRGSTFTLRLPSVRAPALPRPPRESADASSARMRRRVLIVEADADLRAMLRSLLEVSGHHVSDAADGPSAFSIALRARPEVVLIDVELPGFDGYELARRLRMAPETKSVVLIAITGDHREHDAERARLAGFDHYASKPVDPEALAQILQP